MTKLSPLNLPCKLSDDGLRYLDRPAGSMFRSIVGSSARSCFWCGVHRPPSSLVSRRILGKSHVVCADICSKNPAGRKLADAAPDSGAAAPAS